MSTMDAKTLRAVMDTVIDGLITIDAAGIIRSFNPAAVKIFGYEREEVIGRNVKMLMPEPYHAEHDRYLSNYRTTGIPKIIGSGREVAARRKDGSIFPIDLGVSEMRLDDTRMYVGIIRDITERKRQEADQIFLQTLIEHMPEGIITIEEDGVIQRVNPAAEQMFGYAVDEVAGHSITMLLPETCDNAGELKGLCTTDASVFIDIGAREIAGRRKDGSLFAMELSVSRMRVHGKRIYAGLMRDISARKQQERERLQFISDLASSNQQLDDFAYIASHDLKEPLRGLATNALFIKEDYDDRLEERGLQRLDRMVFLCGRMERLVDDLLCFSRLGHQKLAVRRTDLNAVIKDIELMMEGTLQEQHVQLVIPHPLPIIVCDATRITEVFRNLITNAVKYNKAGQKRIEIGCTTADNAVGEQVFYVRDNGIGIAKQFHREIFRIFKRLNVEDDAARGTGVGLTFVQKIIERHNGHIWLESALGEGTTFYFTIGSAEETTSL